MVHYYIYNIFFRLYTENEFEKLAQSTPPEMQRTNLTSVVLQLKALGIDNVLRFNFPTPPPAKNLLSALELLYALHAIDDNGALTEPHGATMAEFALDPLYSKMLLASGKSIFFIFIIDSSKGFRLSSSGKLNDCLIDMP